MTSPSSWASAPAASLADPPNAESGQRTILPIFLWYWEFYFVPELLAVCLAHYPGILAFCQNIPSHCHACRGIWQRIICVILKITSFFRRYLTPISPPLKPLGRRPLSSTFYHSPPSFQQDLLACITNHKILTFTSILLTSVHTLQWCNCHACHLEYCQMHNLNTLHECF